MKGTRLKASLYVFLVVVTGVSIVYAGIPYDVLKLLKFGAKVNVTVIESASFKVYIDSACTMELDEPIDFGSAPKGGMSELRRIYIKNTGAIPGTLMDIRTDTPGLKVIWGSSNSTTLRPGDIVHVWLRLQVEPDMPMGPCNFSILVEFGGGAPDSW
ncbi:hypothetical protein KEJ51_02385 [Candidatus Bathyarchaeota archaeon]|nr:hypothetical protein [Candidatus Bathyarchaeota archaeon]MBS7628447.1 hypothetical protein [Candidatus Bathyarchaeota archaeon]